MDLNASPLPEEDELIFKDHIERDLAQQKLRVTATETMHQVLFFFIYLSSTLFFGILNESMLRIFRSHKHCCNSCCALI